MPDNSIEYPHQSDLGFSQLLNLEGTVAIVTGGTMDIGGAVSPHILEARGTGVASAIAEGRIEPCQGDFGDRLEFFHCDVTGADLLVDGVRNLHSI